VVQIEKIRTEHLLIPIRGTAPLIMHRFSEKAKRQMLEAMQGVKRPKEPKNPEQDYLQAFYSFEGEVGDAPYGFPAIAFKAATISSARLYDKSVTMVGLRQQLFFNGPIGLDGQQLVKIDGDPIMREDVVRVGINGTDLRYRPVFNEWHATLDVTYLSSVLTRDSVLSLIAAGGQTVGVGEWRPEKSGDFGTYVLDGDVQVVGD
jgi:hypothetical protein